MRHILTIVRYAFKGVSQDRVLSCFLYILYILQIAKYLQKTVSIYISIYHFADDIAIYIKFSSFKRAINSSQKAINSISKNRFNIGLQFTFSTAPLHFNNKEISLERVEMRAFYYRIEIAHLFSSLLYRYSSNESQTKFPKLKKKTQTK